MTKNLRPHDDSSPLVVVVVCSSPAEAGQASRPAVFTAEQAEAGRMELQTNAFGACTDCHTTTLGGRRGEPGELPLISSLREDYQTTLAPYKDKLPDLVGPGFRARWAARTTRDLTKEFEERFSRLSEQTRLNLIAYILRANGAQPGPQPLTTTTEVGISSLTSADPQK